VEEPILSDLASRLEHVLLRPAITPTEVGDACAAAVEAGLAAVHVWPTAVADAVAAVDGSGVAVVAAVGGPFGAALRDTKLHEVRRAVAAGARHLAVAVDAGAFRGGDAGALAAELATACYLAHAEGVHVRAVLHAPALTDDERVIAGRLAAEAGADLLQTAFGLDGDATAEQVGGVRRGVPPRYRDIPVVAGGAAGAAAVAALLAGGAERVAMLDPAAALGRAAGGDDTTGRDGDRAARPGAYAAAGALPRPSDGGTRADR
jgi:deoxyribose-phosphate aldolase